MKEEATRTLNFLASNPEGVATVRRAALREIMYETSGQLIARGALHEIRSRSLGAGVYRLSLRRWRKR